LWVPVEALAFPLRTGGHDHGDGLRESFLYGCIGLLPSAEAFEPVAHMAGVGVRDEGERSVGLLDRAVEYLLRQGHAAAFGAAECDAVRGAPDEGVALVRAFLFDKGPALAAFAAGVDEGGAVAHDAGEAVGVVAKAGRVADQESFGVFEEGLEGV